MVQNALGVLVERARTLMFRGNLRTVLDALESASFPMIAKAGVRVYRSNTVVLECRIDDLRVAFDVAVGAKSARLSVLGRDETARRVLRNAFIGVGLNVRVNGERNFLGKWSLWPRKKKTVEGIVAEVRAATERIASLPGETHPGRQLGSADALTYWWDTKANFGDTIGPWLVSAMTGLRPVNRRWVSHDRPALFTVGSVIGHLKTPGEHIWGSGLIGRPGPSKLNQLRSVPPARIHAVRGKWTRDVLIQELGWSVPEVYGDPALLLPRFYDPPAAGADCKIALVPHYKHKQDFALLSGRNATLVDVADGLERVIDQISSSSVVISTSLHGLIIAQAYGIPWVWIRLEDKQLGGDTFKFEDFFSLLKREEVATVHLRLDQLGSLNIEGLAGQASLPTSFYDLDLLAQAFPVQLFNSSIVDRP